MIPRNLSDVTTWAIVQYHPTVEYTVNISEAPVMSLVAYR